MKQSEKKEKDKPSVHVTASARTNTATVIKNVTCKAREVETDVKTFAIQDASVVKSSFTQIRSQYVLSEENSQLRCS